MVTAPELPPHTTALPVIEAVGSAFTFTVADPFSPPVASQLLSTSVLTVYVFDAEGVTATIAGLLDAANEAPLESVPVHGPFPVRAMLNEELLPVQISAEPVSVAVGLGTVVTATLEPLATGHGLLDATTR
jgi:hypothetical protein